MRQPRQPRAPRAPRQPREPGLPRQSALTWVPVYVDTRAGQTVVLSGQPRAHLSDTISIPSRVPVKDLERETIGWLAAVLVLEGALKVSFELDPAAPVPELESKFLLGLGCQGAFHVARALSAAEPRDGDER